MRRIFSWALIFILLFVPNAQALQSNAQIIWLSDADTMRVRLDSGVVTNFRVACIDAPEVPHTKKINPALTGHYRWGKEAMGVVSKLIPLKTQVTITPLATDYRWGRTIGAITLADGSDLAQSLLSQGLAKIYTDFINLCPNKNALQQAQEGAKNAGVGVWGDADYIEPPTARKLANQKVVASEVSVEAVVGLPECVKTDCDCKDFEFQEDAQMVLDAFPTDKFRLDRNKDGTACNNKKRRMEVS